MGVVDTYQLLTEKDNATRFYCIPSGVTAGQLADVYCKYLKTFPEYRNDGAAGLMAVSFSKTWKCK
ncbi:Rap1a/Tai family immunity protein [Rhizobium grahamii]|uniref:Rap1a immunity protein domain-containing protein n=1 Tax=Rhizobium grahamii CCGE 502 TaxID=990285 RepID=S3I0B3_9HYPH|nr:hypothetical protein RGCCGE502_09475 [Rhizobium grahamii CCGE 502]